MKGSPMVIREIKEDDLNNIPRRGKHRKVMLGGEYVFVGVLKEKNLEQMRRRIGRHPQGRLFLVMWEGGMNLPKFTILGYRVSRPAEGILASEGAIVGSYARMISCGGRSGLSQQLLVHFTRGGDWHEESLT